jgi:hypothetical protein
VCHRAADWAIGGLDAVRDAFVFHSATTSLDGALGPESREEWPSAASDGGTDEAEG